MTISCILIDDEPFALDILEDDLLGFKNIEVRAKFNSADAAKSYLKYNTVDLIFTDIQMPNTLGTQFVRGLVNAPLIIFTTAYHQYAVEGFELNAVDYLTKPIRVERLAEAIKKVENQLKFKESNTEDFIILNVEYQKVKIFFDEIIYIEGLKDYVKIYTENRVHPILTRSNLRGIAGKLPTKFFARIHNSYIINKQKVHSYNQAFVQLKDIKLPVGKAFIDVLENI